MSGVGSVVNITDGKVGSKPVKVTNGGLDMNIQDQHTEVIDLHLSQLIQAITITNNTAIDDSTVTITSGIEPVDGRIVCFKEGSSFYQGTILSHSANASDWDIVLDTPLDFAFTTAGGCSERNQNLALAVGSLASPIMFDISPSNLVAGTKWDIVRVIFQITDATAMDDGTFGGIPALTNGIVLRNRNGIIKNIFNAKTNGDMKSHMYDLSYAEKPPAGTGHGLAARRTFGGQSKNGVVVRLDSDTDDAFELLVQDDLTGLVNFQAIVQGHVVE